MTQIELYTMQDKLDKRRMAANVAEEITVWTEGNRLIVNSRARIAGALRTLRTSYPLYPEAIER